jgi:hypothetical protein
MEYGPKLLGQMSELPGTEVDKFCDSIPPASTSEQNKTYVSRHSWLLRIRQQQDY